MPPPTYEKYLIVGLKSVTPSGLSTRQSIDTFSADPTSLHWNLFLAALRALHDEREDDDNPLGFYQIAGVHGVPYINWMEPHIEGDRPMDYCTHRTALFLTWHRPYLLLLEQRLVEEAAKIAQPLGADYQAAALEIRLPYWDWATNSNVPDACRLPKADVTLPKTAGGPLLTTSIDNPLYSYKFQKGARLHRDFQPAVPGDVDPKAPPTFLDMMESKRCPDLKGNTQLDVVDSQLQGHVPDPQKGLPTDWRAGMYRLLLSVDTYGDFSNSGWNPQSGGGTKTHNSLESYHNSIHDYTGTDLSDSGDPKYPFPDGHMADVSTSSFDPIFWLHHTNIDRFYAMWQAINPTSPFEDQTAALTRLPEVPENQTLDTGASPLRPFYHKQPTDQFVIQSDCVWNSNMVQYSNGTGANPSCFDWGYNYPEIPFNAGNDPDKQQALSAAVRASVVALYSPTKLGSIVPKHAYKFPDRYQELPDISDSQVRREWVANIHVKNFFVPGNFSVFVFLGAPRSENPGTWVMSPQLAGTLDTFKAPSEYCVNCASPEQADAFISTSVDLTHILYNQVTASDGIELHDEKKIEDYLKKNLTWRVVQRPSRRVVDLQELLKDDPKALEVSVASFYMSYPQLLRGTLLSGEDNKGVAGVMFGEKNHPAATHDLKIIGGLRK